MAGKRYEEQVVDGVWMGRTHCARCDKPVAPYGVAVPTEHADTYCWGDSVHRIQDLESVLREAGNELAAQAKQCDEVERENLLDMVARIKAVIG